MIGLINVANLVSGRFGVAEVDDILEQSEAYLLLKEIALATLNDLRRRCCIRKLAYSDKLGTEWALHPIRMTLIEAFGSQPLTDDRYLELSRYANAITGLLLQGTSLIAVITSFVQKNKPFESSYDASFDEACRDEVCKDAESYGVLHGMDETTHWRYVRVARLKHRYPEAFQLFQRVSEKAAGSFDGAQKGGPGITRLKSALHSEFEKHYALLLIGAAAVQLKDSTKERKTAGQLNSHALYFKAPMLLKMMSTIREKKGSAS